MAKKKQGYQKTKIVIGVGGGLIASAAGLAALPAVGVGVGVYAIVRWLDK